MFPKVTSKPLPTQSVFVKSGPCTSSWKVSITLKVESQPAAERMVAIPEGLFSLKIVFPKVTSKPLPTQSVFVKSGPCTSSWKVSTTLKVESHPAAERIVAFPEGLFSSKVVFPKVTSKPLPEQSVLVKSGPCTSSWKVSTTLKVESHPVCVCKVAVPVGLDSLKTIPPKVTSRPDPWQVSCMKSSPTIVGANSIFTIKVESHPSGVCKVAIPVGFISLNV